VLRCHLTLLSIPLPRTLRDDGDMPSAAPAEVVESDVETTTMSDRPWIVLVWNDPINLMSYVTLVLQKLFGFPKAKAERLMLDVHQKGRAVVSSGPREQAEFDVFRLHEHGLWATMEQPESGK
jgi:ATP-dependent Clp protease adaptor protein ClpS